MRGTVTRVEMFPDAHLVTFPWVSFLQPNVTSACVCWQTYIQAGVENQVSKSMVLFGADLGFGPLPPV